MPLVSCGYLNLGYFKAPLNNCMFSYMDAIKARAVGVSARHCLMLWRRR